MKTSTLYPSGTCAAEASGDGTLGCSFGYAPTETERFCIEHPEKIMRE